MCRLPEQAFAAMNVFMGKHRARIILESGLIGIRFLQKLMLDLIDELRCIDFLLECLDQLDNLYSVLLLTPQPQIFFTPSDLEQL